MLALIKHLCGGGNKSNAIDDIGNTDHINDRRKIISTLLILLLLYTGVIEEC